MTALATHHKVCLDTGLDDVQLTITVGHRPDGTLHTVVHFPDGQRLEADAGDPPLGMDELDNCLHDVTHTLLAARVALGRSPVLERVVELRPLSQRDVDLEELATFATQAWCLAIAGEDPGPALVNASISLGRLS